MPFEKQPIRTVEFSDRSNWKLTQKYEGGSFYLSIPDLEIEDLELTHEVVKALGYIQLYTRSGVDLLNIFAKEAEEWL